MPGFIVYIYMCVCCNGNSWNIIKPLALYVFLMFMCMNLGEKKRWWSFEHHRMEEDGLKMSQKNPQPTNEVGNPGIWGFLKMRDTVPKSPWPSWVSIGFNGHSWLGWCGVPAWLRESPFDDISRKKMEPFEDENHSHIPATSHESFLRPHEK